MYNCVQVGKSVRDFFARKDACATPRRFTGQTASTPARKLKFAPDIIAGIEEDEYGEAAKDLTGRVWRVFKVRAQFTDTILWEFFKYLRSG